MKRAILTKYKNGDPAIKVIFPFNYTDLEVARSLPGRSFNKDKKFWVCPLSVEAVEKLKEAGFALDPELQNFLGTAKLNVEDVDNIEIPGLKKQLFPFQTKGVSFIEQKNGNALIADEMGCIDGEAIIDYNRAGAGGKKIKLKDLYKKFKGKGSYKWDLSIPTKIKCLKGDILGLHPVKDVLFKGKKPVLEIKLKSGKKLKLTNDHLVLDKNHQWIEAEKLSIGSIILTNGKEVCKNCGSENEIVTYSNAKFKGYCKSCVYKYLRKNKNKVFSTKRMGSDGYYYLKGDKYKNHPRYSSGGLLEHIFIMENYLKRPLNNNEQVHHINEIKSDNRINNLKLVTKSEHSKIHNKYLHLNNGKTKSDNTIILIPREDKVISIEYKGETEVYDIVMNDPYRNFIANGIVVHNCGKTIQALAYLQLHPEKRPAVIVCPASLKLNWKKEIEDCMSTNDVVEILSGQTPSKPTGDIIIINYDIVDKWLEILKNFGPNVLILDEVHYTKNNSAKRTKAIKRLAKYSQHIIGLSGTPIENKPIEIFNAVNMINKTVIPNFWSFAKKYCGAKHNGFGWDFSGATNIKELHEKLSNTVMIRRRKADVLKDLPAKVHSFVPIDLANKKEYDNAVSNIDIEVEQDRMNILSQIEALKQLAVKGKMKGVVNWIKDFLSVNDKLVVFAHHKFVIDELMKEFGKEAVKVDGSVSQKDRNESVERFQNDNNIKLFVGNLKAAGVGITLTASSNVAVIEFPWTPGELVQAIDRCHRIGQEDTVNAYFLTTTGTIEEEIAHLLDYKSRVVEGVLDGKEFEEESILSELIEKYKKEFAN